MNQEYINILSKNKFTACLGIQEIDDLINKRRGQIKTYKKGETLYESGDPCNNLSIVLKGKIELSNFLISGDVSSLVTLSSGDVFGEAVLFAEDNAYPVTSTALSQVSVLLIPRDVILQLMNQYPKFNERYLSLLSQKIIFLNDKFKLLSLTTIRGKIAHVLLKLSKEQGSLKVTLPFSKEKMATHISTRRPSLSRELSKMKSEGLIDYERSTIHILDIDSLEDQLY